MTDEYSNIQLDPEFDEWANGFRPASFDNARLDDLRTAARKRLVQAAEQFTLRLSGIAEEAGVEIDSAPIATGTPDEQSIVMTGHQPVVFHPGLSFKYDTTAVFVRQQRAIGIAVVIDTDQGDAGQFSFPEADGTTGRPIRAIETLATANDLYLSGRLKTAAEIREIGSRVCKSLETLGETVAAGHCQAAINGFARLATARATAMEANLIMRWQAGIGHSLLEIPLSAIASFPESVRLVADILKQPQRFASAYNESLELFREENDIRNAANPFPNLKITSKRCELPFWVVSHNRGRRYALEAEVSGNTTRLLANDKTLDTFTGNITGEALEPLLVQNIQIVPKGALITTFLRLLFADLFVHGVGGGRYDRFTDEFIRTWWNVEPPCFTVASATQQLFKAQRSELHRLSQLKSSLRELQYNPQRHFGTGVFSTGLEAVLTELTDKKAAAVDRMKASHQQGESARELGREIQQITNQIRDAVDKEFEPQLLLLNELTPEQKDAIFCRTYPWFMFR